MSHFYETVQGDTFDIIAKKFYGNENRIDILIEHNKNYLDTVFFAAGVEIFIPDLPPNKIRTDGLPPWRKKNV